MAFNLSDYQTVQDRISVFRELYPDGRIVNDLVLINEKEVVVKCSVWLDQQSVHPVAVDFAQETIGSTNINKTSFLENCSTSAAGRALALLGGRMSPKGKKPSREEMLKVVQANPAPNHDYLAEAKVLRLAKDLDGLRRVYAQAEAAKAPTDILEAITALAKEVKTV